MLRVDGVSKRIGRFELKDISFHLPKGYIMGLIGPNGAGKTSLIHMILGLTSPDQGEIWIGEKAYLTQEKESKDELGWVLAETIFEHNLSLQKLASYYGQFYTRYSEADFLQYARDFELDLAKKGKGISKGEKMKFQCAFALAHHPSLLILDEPTANFDPNFRKQFLSLMSQFVSDGEHSILISTHLTKELDRLADYVTFINKGKLIFSENKEKLLDEYRLVSGENYKINLLRKERMIYKEEGAFVTKALMKGDRYKAYDQALTLEIPTIEDIMYFTVKGRGE